jgi:hypothetical protein
MAENPEKMWKNARAEELNSSESVANALIKVYKRLKPAKNVIPSIWSTASPGPPLITCPQKPGDLVESTVMSWNQSVGWITLHQ